MSTPVPPSPTSILNLALERALTNLDTPFIDDLRVAELVEYVCRCPNLAGTRFLIACLLAKLASPVVDIRKPYTEIGGEGTFSGRHYDEMYVTPFIFQNKLPLNPTSAFLTPAFRTNKSIIQPGVELIGRPIQLYLNVVELITLVHSGGISPENLLAEIIRWLIIVRNEREQRVTSLMASLKSTKGQLLLSAESIITLIEQHMALPKSSRLPVLVIAAAYEAAREYLGERHLPLQGHNAADKQTGSLGDVEIVLRDDNNIVTVYEMKAKVVTLDDIDIALQKIASGAHNIDNFIFITTDRIDRDVQEYAATLHSRVGVEFVILDCIGFLRHFLHLFYRVRLQFLEAYEALVMSEPDSSVNPALREAFLALRLAIATAATQSGDDIQEGEGVT